MMGNDVSFWLSKSIAEFLFAVAFWGFIIIAIALVFGLKLIHRAICTHYTYHEEQGDAVCDKCKRNLGNIYRVRQERSTKRK